MNILVLGNGFDLAHGLPTKYTDFLEFVKMIKIIKEKDIFDDGVSVGCAVCNVGVVKLHQDFRLIIFNKANNKELKRDLKELLDYIDNNFWIDYFLQCDMHGNENWIDFESEISEVIKSLDDDMHGLSQIYNIEDIVNDLSNDFLREMYSDYIDVVQSINPVDNGFSEGISFKEIRDKLLKDLNRLIKAFEIYLTEYVEKIDIEVISPDIEEIAATIYDDRGQKGILFSKVISFNYTNIYEQIYLHKYDIDCNDYVDYIHGKANANNTIDTNNMVLGIDEYLGKKKRNKYVEFIAFKKFYQRIHKGTGCKYKEWTDTIKGDFADYQIELEKSKAEKNIMNLKATVNKLKKQYLNKHNVYFFGHSLDVTDKDILRDLILNDNVHATIFYHDKDTMGKQIANLVKVIGQDELIKRTGGKDKLIEFKPQKTMTERKEE